MVRQSGYLPNVPTDMLKLFALAAKRSMVISCAAFVAWASGSSTDLPNTQKDACGDYFAVQISGEELKIPLPRDLQLYLTHVVSRPGLTKDGDLKGSIPVGSFFIQGKEYRWLGESKIYLLGGKGFLFLFRGQRH